MSDTTIKFRRSFACGGVGSLTIAAPDNRLPQPLLDWVGPRPSFVETIEWAKECFEKWTNRFNRPAQFVAISPEGVCEFWEFAPGALPECACRAGRNPPLREAVKFACTILSSNKANKNIKSIGVSGE